MSIKSSEIAPSHARTRAWKILIDRDIITTRNFLLKIIYLSIYINTFHKILNEIVYEGMKNCENEKLPLSYFIFSFSRFYFFHFHNAPLLLNYPANESNAWYIPSETMWLVKNSLLSLQSHRVI